MSKTDAVLRQRDPREVAAAPATLALKVAAARSTLGEMRQRANDLGREARSRARGEIARRRAVAATRLENLAATVRPQHKLRARRRTAAIAGGSTLALVAALGAGVAIGMYLARRLNAKGEAAADDAKGVSETPPVSARPADASAAPSPPAR